MQLSTRKTKKLFTFSLTFQVFPDPWIYFLCGYLWLFPRIKTNNENKQVQRVQISRGLEFSREIITHHNHIALLEEKCSANFHDYATEVERLFLHAIKNNLPLNYSLFHQARENIPIFWPWTRVKFSKKDRLQHNLEISNTLENKIQLQYLL